MNKAASERIDDTFSKFIAYFVVTKLDTKIAENWENSITATRTFPLFNDLKRFIRPAGLKCWAQILQNVSIKTEDRPPRSREYEKRGNTYYLQTYYSHSKYVIFTNSNHN